MEKYLGFIWQRDTYTEQLIVIFRYVTVFGAVGITLYGFLVLLGVISYDHFNFYAFIFASGAFLALSFWALLDKNSSLPNLLVRAVGFHVIAPIFILFVAGFLTPLTSIWIILFIGSHSYFGTWAMYVSTFVLVLTGVLDVILLQNGDPYTALINLTYIIVLVFIGLTVVWVERIQAKEHYAFRQTRATEGLHRDRMISLVNSISDAIINVDGKGVIRTYNAASLDLFNTNASLNGQELDDILTLKNDQNEDVSLFASVNRSHAPTVRDDLSVTLKDGDIMRLAINVSPVRTSYGNGKTIQDGYIFILRDITKAKTLEQEKDEFISVVSHELRTPITIAEGTISNAQMFMGKKVSEAQVKKALDQAHQQVVFLAKMVNDLSTLSRAERGVGDAAEEIDIDSLLHGLYKKYEPQAAAKGLQLNLDIHQKIGAAHTSRLYLEEILQNFITNAIKYTAKGSVTITARRVEPKHDDKTPKSKHPIHFAVEDTGIGISRSDQKSIFKKFYRSEDYRTRETSGTGLGLYVSQKLAEKLGTEIEFSSRLNHGSTFGFTLEDQA